jgi:hypothetical protein
MDDSGSPFHRLLGTWPGTGIGGPAAVTHTYRRAVRGRSIQMGTVSMGMRREG